MSRFFSVLISSFLMSQITSAQIAPLPLRTLTQEDLEHKKSLSDLRVGEYVQLIADSEINMMRYLEGEIYRITTYPNSTLRDFYVQIGRDVNLYVAVSAEAIHAHRVIEGPTKLGEALLTRDVPAKSYLQNKIAFRPSKRSIIDASRKYFATPRVLRCGAIF